MLLRVASNLTFVPTSPHFTTHHSSANFGYALGILNCLGLMLYFFLLQGLVKKYRALSLTIYQVRGRPQRREETRGRRREET